MILREPITRAYSLYNHARRKSKGVPETFAEAVRDEVQVRGRGHEKGTAATLEAANQWARGSRCQSHPLPLPQALIYCREQDETRASVPNAVSDQE